MIAARFRSDNGWRGIFNGAVIGALMWWGLVEFVVWAVT